MCAAATPPGGMVATFMESFFAPTFFADSPDLYLIPFHPRTLPPPRIVRIPCAPSTFPNSVPGSMWPMVQHSSLLELDQSAFLRRHRRVALAARGVPLPGRHWESSVCGEGQV